jgi:glutamate carboxypeptidase
MRHATALLVFLLAPAPIVSAADGLEPKIVAAVDRQVPARLALLERVVNVNSGTSNHAGIQEVGRIFGEELKAVGFETRWVPGDAYRRAGHLIAEHRAKQPKLRVLLIGHLDTVFEKDSPFQRYELLPGDQARGPAVTDMKGGDVIIVTVLAALREAGALEHMDVTVYMGGDEEDSGDPLSAARADLMAAAEGMDVALGFEDGDGLFETAVIARRGSTDWKVTVTGKPAHSSLILNDEVGAGAIYEAARILDGFRREVVPAAGQATFNPGMMVAGTTVENPEQARGTAFGKTNVVAGQAVVHGDLRAYSVEQVEDIRRRMREVASKNLPQTSAVVEFGEGYPPMAASDGNRKLLGVFDQVSRDLGFGPVTAVDPRQAGAADISFVAGKVKMAMDGVGLMGRGGHTVEETADLTTFAKQAKRVAVLLYRLSRP